MAKADIASTKLLPWDEYKDKPIVETLKSIYERAISTSRTVCGWYWAGIRMKRKTSLGVRWITFFLLIIGTVLPILAGLNGDAEVRLQFTQLGVAALALGGLLQVADRVFGWSSGWIRYVTTVTAMENLTRKFELEWAGYLLNKIEPLTTADDKQLFDLAKRFENDIVKLQSDETDKWVTEFNTGMALLGDLIKTQRESGEKAITAANAAVTAQQNAARATEKAKQNGAIELTLVHKTEVKPVTVAIDEEPPEEFTGTVWSKLNVPPGQHTINVVTSGAAPQTIQKVVEVASGDISHVEVKLA
ncbi:MAG: hypothetical protein CSYNP_00487 [Syntrophus sp. SKADARSKE-3]|nr:hypothetical protein [Syntrophus sp. SKADARSKE-3]